MVKDRSLAKQQDARNAASIAATGFGLTALCIAAERAGNRATPSRSVSSPPSASSPKNFPTSTASSTTSSRWTPASASSIREVSTIDTAIFLCGALACRAYFANEEISRLVLAIYDRIDWDFFLKGGPSNELTLSMGWRPEKGYIKTRLDSYSELMMLYLLGMGANRNPLPAACWDAWSRPMFEFNGIRYIGAHAPLFVHQFSHALV